MEGATLMMPRTHPLLISFPLLLLLSACATAPREDPLAHIFFSDIQSVNPPMQAKATIPANME